MGNDLSQTFSTITQYPEDFSIDSVHMKRLEQFTIGMYSQIVQTDSINEARLLLFRDLLKPIDQIPPSQEALFQHARRSIFAANIWWKSGEKNPEYLDPSKWGWTLDDEKKMWKPFLTALPAVSKGCLNMASCGCRKGCVGNCKCRKNSLRCTSVCHCRGLCKNNAG